MTAEEKLAVRKLIQDAQTVEEVHAVQEAVRKGTVKLLLSKERQKRMGEVKQVEGEGQGAREGSAEIGSHKVEENGVQGGDGVK